MQFLWWEEGNYRVGALIIDCKSCFTSGLNFQHKMKLLALIEDELEQWRWGKPGKLRDFSRSERWRWSALRSSGCCLGWSTSERPPRCPPGVGGHDYDHGDDINPDCGVDEKIWHWPSTLSTLDGRWWLWSRWLKPTSVSVSPTTTTCCFPSSNTRSFDFPDKRSNTLKYHLRFYSYHDFRHWLIAQ